MKGLKEVKYTDQWFKHQANQLSIDPSDRLKKNTFKLVKGKSRSLPLWQWIAGTAALVALMVAGQFLVQKNMISNQASAMQIETVPAQSQDAFYHEMTSFIGSADYMDMVKKYQR